MPFIYDYYLNNEKIYSEQLNARYKPNFALVNGKYYDVVDVSTIGNTTNIILGHEIKDLDKIRQKMTQYCY